MKLWIFVIKKNERQKDRSINYKFGKRVEISNISGIILQKERDQKYNTIIKTKPKFMAKKNHNIFLLWIYHVSTAKYPYENRQKNTKKRGDLYYKRTLGGLFSASVILYSVGAPQAFQKSK